MLFLFEIMEFLHYGLMDIDLKRWFETRLRIDPKNSKAHYNLGNILLIQEKTKEAITHFAEAIKINPDYVDAYNKIGSLLFQKGKLNKAKVFFSKAIQIDPNYSEAHKNLEILNQISSSSRELKFKSHWITESLNPLMT